MSTDTSTAFSAPVAAAPGASHLMFSSSQQSTTTQKIPDPVCSILNVVIQYEMHPPTAMEPREFQQEQERQQQKQSGETSSAAPASSSSSPLLVPVLRVFGPIVRRDVTVPHRTPAQSACLYIHGAFPYLLARPCIAGPDGSLHPFRSADQRFIDWDDWQAVERIVPVLQTALEQAIVASSSFANTTSGQDNKPSHKEASSAAIIRRITVVMGRGFYTYCPGPSAPFLRVEYYNPAERWKVKRSLEQGLDVDALYHPDPRQYTTATGQGPIVPDESALLRFHCYEAHIPYTMQFFKDYNLAGLSYIHAQNPKFRSLPKQRRQTFAMYEESPVDPKALFLESNASQYLWPASPPSSSQPALVPSPIHCIQTCMACCISSGDSSGCSALSR